MKFKTSLLFAALATLLPGLRPKRRCSTSIRPPLSDRRGPSTPISRPKTGIRINRIGAGGRLLERIRNGGQQPGGRAAHRGCRRLAKAHELGLFAPVVEGAGGADPGPSAHRRLVFVLDPRAGDRLSQGQREPDDVKSYDDLAKPALKGKLCSRSGSHPTTCRLARRSSPTRARRRPRSGRGAWWPTLRVR